MAPALLNLMDELGLQALVDGFIATAHYQPDRARLSHYADPVRRADVRSFIPEARAARLEWGAVQEQRSFQQQAFRFPSPLGSPFLEDQQVHGIRYLPRSGGATGRAGRAVGTVIMAHGGYVGVQPNGADFRPYQRWALELTRLGLQVYLPALPRHLQRAPAGTFSGERFLSGNLLETIDAIVQATTELQALVGALVEAGEGPVGLMGMSLGGLTSIQLLSLEPRISAAVLMAPVPDAPRSLFESEIGRSIRVDWQAGGMDRADLQAVFEALSPRCRVPLLARDAIRLVAGTHDDVVQVKEVEEMGRVWGAEVWVAPAGHLGLMSDARLREQATGWLGERLRGS